MVLDLLMKCPCSGHLISLKIRLIYKLRYLVQKGKESMSQVEF